MEKRTLTKHETDVLRSCSSVLPSVVLMELLGAKHKVFTRLRNEIGIKPTLSESKRTSSSFLQSLPELHDLPLTEDEKKQVRLYRLNWLNRRSKEEALARPIQILESHSHSLPTKALAAILSVPVNTVLRLQRENEIEVSRSERRRLSYAFAASDVAPRPEQLNASEMTNLRKCWEQARKERSKRNDTAFDKKQDFAAKMLREQLKDRAAFSAEVPLSPCSGRCKEHWPRDARFFTSNWRREDGLSDRCKYCSYLGKEERKHQGTTRQNAKRGRILSSEEEARLRVIFAEYSFVVPNILLQYLFRLGKGTMSRLWREESISMTMKRSRETNWRWYFRKQVPELPLLNEKEIGRLYLLTRKLDEYINNRFKPDRALRAILDEESIKIRCASTDEDNTLACRKCKRLYPATKFFFRRRKDDVENHCKVCESYAKSQRRRKRLEKRFGGL